jgi:hypothetical protein
VLSEIGIDFLLYFRDFVYVFYTNTTWDVLSWLVASLLYASGFLYEPRCGRRLDHELEASIHIGRENDTHGHFGVVLASAFIKFFTKLHHVNTEGTQSLTDFG